MAKMKYQRQVADLKVGTHVPAIIETEGLRIKAMVVVSGIANSNAIEYTIPNMHFRVQNGKLVENIKLAIGESENLAMASGSFVVTKPLTELARK